MYNNVICDNSNLLWDSDVKEQSFCIILRLNWYKFKVVVSLRCQLYSLTIKNITKKYTKKEMRRKSIQYITKKKKKNQLNTKEGNKEGTEEQKKI